MAVAVMALVLPTPAQAQSPSNGYLTMRDGVRLRYSVALPNGPGPYPVLLNYSGYDAGVGAANSSGYPLADLLAAGYAVVGVNARGTGCSSGHFEMLERSWADDAYEVIEWITRQSFSNGRVGMFGSSFPGVTQWTVARRPPPGLVALTPASTLADPYRDDAMPGGIMNYEFFALWLGIQNGLESSSAAVALTQGDGECLANLAAHEAADSDRQVLARQVNNPYFNGFWRGIAASEEVRRLPIPTLVTNTWQDDATGSRVMASLAEMVDRDRLWVIAGNGGHGRPGDFYAVFHQLIKFWDHYLKGLDNGWERTPHTQLLFENAADPTHRPDAPPRPASGAKTGFRLMEDGWPPATAAVRLHLDADGRLAAKPPTAATAGSSYAYPRPSPSLHGIYATGVERASWKEPVAPGGAVAWTTPPIEQDAVLFGSSSADLWLRSTADDTDVQVTMTEVRPDGQEVYIQRGWLRASHRALDPQRSTELQPYHPHTDAAAKPLAPDEPSLLRVEFRPVAHALRAGSSLRLIVDAPTGATGTMGFRYLTTPATNTILHDREHASALAVGLLPGRRAGAPMPACDTLLNQPCRPDLIGQPSGSLLLAPKPQDRAGSRAELPAGRSCRSHRRLAIRLRRAPGDRIIRATIRVGQRRPMTIDGRRFRRRPDVRIDLRGLPRGTYAVTVKLRLRRRGKLLTTTDKRSYRTCRTAKR